MRTDRVEIRREKGTELHAEDRHGKLFVGFFVYDGVKDVIPKEHMELEGQDIDFFAGMLLDPACLDERNTVTLKGDYPYMIRVVWDKVWRILSFLDWGPSQKPIRKIRLSPLEALQLGRLAERTAVMDHLLKRLEELS